MTATHECKTYDRECAKCRVAMLLRAFRGNNKERGTWSEDLSQSAGTAVEVMPRGPRWGR